MSGIIPIDVQSAGTIEPNNYDAVVAKVDYQVKTGEKWNQDGTTTVSKEEFITADHGLARIKVQFNIDGHGPLWREFYMSEKARVFLKDFLHAANVPFSKEGFDPDDAVGNTIGLKVALKDEGEYGMKNDIASFYRV